MPLLYGEGSRAFHHFQQEVIRNMTDLSLLPWRATNQFQSFTSIFATHPRHFAARKECTPVRLQFSCTSEVTITSKGLRIGTAPFVERGQRRSDLEAEASCSRHRLYHRLQI